MTNGESKKKELGGELQRLEKLMVENDQLRKKFLKFRNSCTTSKTEEEQMADSKAVNQLVRLYKDACATLQKSEGTIAACIEKIDLCTAPPTEEQSPQGPVRKKLRTSSSVTNNSVPTTSGSDKPYAKTYGRKSGNGTTSAAPGSAGTLSGFFSSSNGLGSSSQSLPVAPVSSEEEDIIPPGEQVAAQVSDPKKKGKKTEWILARISRYLRDKKKYEVEDEYDEDSGDEGSSKQGRKHYVLPRQSLIVLPKEGDPDYPEFAKESRVLAVFPHTTTFYPAIVYKAPPSSRKGRGEYLLKFADDEEEGSSEPPPRKVPAHHVVALPKMFSK